MSAKWDVEVEADWGVWRP